MKRPGRRKKRIKTPLDAAGARDLALSYAARYATSAAKLRAYLLRKIRERGIEEGGEAPDVDAIVARLVELRYVDDEAFAQARAGALLRRGYGERRVADALRLAGIAEELRDEVAPGEAARRHAALAMVRKRGFGPFGEAKDDPRSREKQIASMLRAGHGFDAARALIDAGAEQEAEDWAHECDDEQF